MLSDRQVFLRHLAQTSGTSLQFEIDRAEGIYFYDTSGKAYIDLVSGVSVSNLGHGHPSVVEAVREQAGRYMHTMVYGEFVQSPQTRYASWLINRLPAGLDTIYYVSSGSEAIEGAMKLAKRYTGRRRMLAFENSYHGGTQGALSILGDPGARSGFLPLLPGVGHLRFNRGEDLERIDETVAAVIMEPIQAEAGVIEPADGFLQKVRQRCTDTGTLLILDEIQTGMGRTGKFLACEHFQVIPDILCMAKSFGGGMPLGAFIAPGEVMHSLTHDPPLGHITTFGGHPVSCAAALAAHRYVEDNRLMSHSVRMERRYRKRLRHPLIKEIRGRGLMLAVVLQEGADVNEFIRSAFRNRLVIDRFLFSVDSFRIAPPLIISEKEVEESSALVLETLDRLDKI